MTKHNWNVWKGISDRTHVYVASADNRQLTSHAYARTAVKMWNIHYHFARFSHFIFTLCRAHITASVSCAVSWFAAPSGLPARIAPFASRIQRRRCAVDAAARCDATRRIGTMARGITYVRTGVTTSRIEACVDAHFREGGRVPYGITWASLLRHNRDRI